MNFIANIIFNRNHNRNRNTKQALTMSDDNVMMKQSVGTHAPDGREVDVKPLLYLVEDILKRATLQIDNLQINNSLTVYF